MVPVAPVVGASVPTVGGRGGKRSVKPGPPPPAGGEAPWGGGKRSVKERETETTPASQKTPVTDVSRQARAVWVSTSPQNSKTGAVWVSTDAVGAAKRTGGDRRNGRTRPRGRHVPRHHPVDPSPGMPIALETHWPMAPSVDEVSHSRGIHTPLTPHGAARSCSRRVEVLRLARLLDTPAGSLRLTHRKTGGVFAPAGSDPYTW